MKCIISKGDCVVDVGAAGGYFALIAAKRGAKVIAFEPIPDLRLLLERNLEKNGYKNCVVSEFALLDENTTRILSKPGVKSRISNKKKSISRNKEDLLIECRRFDEIRYDLNSPKIDVVKMDIEGAEYHALLGMSDTLLKDHPRLLIELHPNLFSEFGYTVKDIFSFLEGLGYSISPVDVSQTTFTSIRRGEVLDNIVVYCVKK